MDKELNFKAFRAVNDKELETLEGQHRTWKEQYYEAMPWANGTSFVEIAKNVIPDQRGEWRSPVVLFVSEHSSVIGARNLSRKAAEFFGDQGGNTPLDVLSVSAGMQDGILLLKILVRVYSAMPDMQSFFASLGDEIVKKEHVEEQVRGQLLIPDVIKNFHYTKKQEEEHERRLKEQDKAFASCTKEKPFLNQLKSYEPAKLPRPEDNIDLIYDLKTKDMSVCTVTDYKVFTEVFNDIMKYVSGVEYYHFVNVMLGEESEADFLSFMDVYIRDTYVAKNVLASEDMPIMMAKVQKALFQLHVVQDLIDDPEVTDVKITAPNSIRARVKGKAYMSNIYFVDQEDYMRFVNGICLRNRVSQDVPEQSFVDTHDKNYILRFSLTAAYVNSVDWPYLHIRKVSRRKMMAKDLMEAGMFDAKVRDYLLDCGKNSRGVVFAGSPGCGKTVILNWYLEEAYEQSAEILVIQENDELFAYRKGVMFQHVVNYPQRGMPAVTLEGLGQLALVAGANVFVIGEVKGAEICSAITLSNSGCRTAMTIHSPSSTETIDKMADLAMRGYASDYDQAKRMLKSFQTIVYMENFKVKEISEIIGYDEQKKDMIYRYIYRRDAEPQGQDKAQPQKQQQPRGKAS